MFNGRLIYDISAERLDIVAADGGCYGGLHCGETLEVLCPCCQEWRGCRVEYGSDWFLAELGELGKQPELFLSLPARIE